MGKLIVIEGLDGSGKATQSGLLYDVLSANGANVCKVTFPDYESNSSALVKMYLAGEFGAKADDVNAYAASTFYAVDRYASYKTKWHDFYTGGGVVIADRYTTSNAVHQCSKLPKEQWDAYLDWLFEFEYKYISIPKPDAVIYLDVDTDISQRLLEKRYNGDESKRDIHEKDKEYLAHSQAAARYCAEKYGWLTVKCCDNGAMRSIEDIHFDVKTLVKNIAFTV
jgi:dTMP kinase